MCVFFQADRKDVTVFKTQKHENSTYLESNTVQLSFIVDTHHFNNSLGKLMVR